MTVRLATLSLLATLTAGTALAQAETTAPADPMDPAATATTEPAGATGGMTLSAIIDAIESEDRFGMIESIDWDEDGYWEVDYRRDDGARIEIEIDAATGQPWVRN